MAESTNPSQSPTVEEVQDLVKEVNGAQNGDEVYPNIYIGDHTFIVDKEKLKSLGITHVLNPVEGNQPFQVDTNAEFYSDVGMKYMGVKGIDWITFDVSSYLRPTAEFIHNALQAGGKVAVDCFLGCGASVVHTLSYIMLYKDMSLMAALEAIGGKRQLWPNDGYVKNLIDLDTELRATRGDTSKPPTLEEVKVHVRKVNNYNQGDEVYPNIFVGDEAFIRGKETLQSLGITHVLNAAEGDKLFQVNTGQSFYTDVNMGYMGVPAADTKDFTMADYFRPAADYVHAALQDGGKVGVNCYGGASRSATLVLAYLILYEKMPLVDAIRTMGAKRVLNPNAGFVKQLIELENELRK